METNDGTSWLHLFRPQFALPRERERKREREREREKEGKKERKARVERNERRSEKKQRVKRGGGKRATPRRVGIPEATLEICSRKSSRGALAHKPYTHARVHTQRHVGHT